MSTLFSKPSSRLPSTLTLVTRVSLLGLVLVASAACAGADPSETPLGPDAGRIVLDPAGSFAVRSTFSLRAAPDAVSAVLGELHAATDGPDDPSRYLVDLVVARLPQGTTRDLAQLLAPYVATYVNNRLADVAPHLIAGVRALTTGLDRIATRFGTLERLRIDGDGRATRTLDGLHLEGVDLAFGALGIPEVTTATSVALDGSRLEIRGHTTHLPYARMLRLGLDQVVIPHVVPGARDLARALRDLVDCVTLGAVIAEAVGLGSPGMYAQACTIGLTVAASEIYDRLPPIDAPHLGLEVVGTARAFDRDADGAMDTFEGGTWSGLLDGVPLGDSTFEGTLR